VLGDEDVAFGLGCMGECVDALTEQITKIERHVLKRAKLREEFKPLLSVWGIGKVLALTVMYEVGDIRRFPSVGDYASYCRCVKSVWLTNNKKKGRGNTKNGNPYLSWAYSEAAHYAQRYREPARKFYKRKQAQRNGIVANRALAHKLARASFFVMRDQVPFDPEKLFK
jgi:transposase